MNQEEHILVTDAYILVNGRMAITGTGADAATRQADEREGSNI